MEQTAAIGKNDTTDGRHTAGGTFPPSRPTVPSCPLHPRRAAYRFGGGWGQPPGANSGHHKWRGLIDPAAGAASDLPLQTIVCE